MNFVQQINIIDELIAENPDATIADYIDLLNDIITIEQKEKAGGGKLKIMMEIKQVIKMAYGH